MGLLSERKSKAVNPVRVVDSSVPHVLSWELAYSRGGTYGSDVMWMKTGSDLKTTQIPEEFNVGIRVDCESRVWYERRPVAYYGRLLRV